jgi:hypothetical protein
MQNKFNNEITNRVNVENPPPPPSNAQNKDDSKEVLQNIEEMPEFTGGTEALNKFITVNAVYPKAAKDEGVQGKVFVIFVVFKHGKIGKIDVLRGVDPLFDA